MISMKKAIFVVAFVGVVSAACVPGFAATITWQGGGGNGNWGTTANWTGGVSPASGDTAVFNSAGNPETTIHLNITTDLDTGPGAATVNTVVFDTASAAAYTIGTGGVGVDTLTLNAGGSIVVNAGVVNAQTMNANVTLLGDAAFANNAANASGGLLT
ncbi:MAG: hypothetical protein EOM66_10385, partial [Clostridia bacterium]|nr:hypothetical protein [Clostridia bacterium]